MKRKTRMIVVASLLTLAAVPSWLSAQNPNRHTKRHARYKLVDISLGGPSSVSLPISSDGAVIGTSCFDTACAITHAFRWDKGVLTDLGALPGENSSIPTWINDHGRIVGFSTNGEEDPLIGGPEIRGVRFRRDGSVTELGILEGGTQTFALQNNNRGDAVGFGNNSIADAFSMIGLGTQTRAILWRHGVPHDLGTLGGDDAAAAFINDNGQVSGQSFTNSAPNPTTGIPTQDPFLWEKGRMLDLGTLGGTSGFPEALNNRGQVVGQSNLEGDVAFHPFLWERGKLKDLGTFGGDDGQAIWLNDRGEIIGEADYPIACGPTCGHPQVYRPFLWRHGRMTDLGAVPGDVCGFAYGINSRTQVVGSNGQCHGGIDAFLWEKGTIYNLNDLIPSNSPLHLVFGYFISDRGEIIGVGVPPGVSVYDAGTLGHAFLLIPFDKHDDDDRENEEGVAAEVARNNNPANAKATASPSLVSSRPAAAMRTRLPGRYRMY